MEKSLNGRDAGRRRRCWHRWLYCGFTKVTDSIKYLEPHVSVNDAAQLALLMLLERKEAKPNT
eukprot:scaffold14726_cov62-Phaeocystis_antarctica.AAC.2